MMNRYIYIHILALSAFFFYSCRGQSNEEKMRMVTKQIISSIQKDDANTFISLVGGDNLDIISKTDEMVKYDVHQFNGLFMKYSGLDNPKFAVTNLYNNLGKRVVRIFIYDYSSDNTGIKRDLYVPGVTELHLNIYFGPPNFIPLNKISGYSLIRNNSDSSEFKPYEYWKKGG